MAGGYIYINLSESNVNVANNTSYVYADVYYVGNGQSWNHNACSGSIYINGTYAGGISHTFEKSGTQWIGGAGLTITHNTDGSKSISASASFTTGVSLGTLSASASKTLTTIPRATQPTLSPTSITLPDTVTISLPRASSGFTHTVKFTVGGHTETIATGVGTTLTWSAPLSVANYITTAVSGTVVIEVETFNGSTSIGKKTANLTVAIPSSCVPSVSNLTVVDELGYKNTYGAFIQGWSKVKALFTEVQSYSSPIGSRSIAIGQNSANTNPFTIEPILKSGNLTVKASLTDGRLRTGSKTTTIEVLAYSKPQVSMNAVRSNSSGEPEPTGEFITCNFQASITSLNGINSGTYKIMYQSESEDPDNGSWTELTVGLNGSVTFPASASDRFRVKFLARDDLSESSSAILIIPTAYVGMSWAKDASGKITGVHIGGTAKDGEGFVSEIKSEFKSTMTVNEAVTLKGGITVNDIDYTITSAEYDELISLLGE